MKVVGLTMTAGIEAILKLDTLRLRRPLTRASDYQNIQLQAVQFPISNISMEHILKNDAATGMSFQCKGAEF